MKSPRMMTVTVLEESRAGAEAVRYLGDSGLKKTYTEICGYF